MRKSVLIVLILIASLSTLTPAQRRSTIALRDPRLSKTRPSVYITFERQGKIASLSGTGELQDTVWLRLRNNTRWPVVLDMNGVPKEYGDAGLFHDVLSDGKVIAEERCHACSFNPLPPGHYIVFTVPRADLAQGRSIRVRFSYGWEDHNPQEVEHFVYFHSSQLTKPR